MEEISKPIGAPSDWEEMSDWEKLCLLPTKVQHYYLLQLIEEGVDFEHLPMELIMRPKQLALIRSDEWITLFSAGRGSGKTRTGSSWVIERAKDHPGCIIHLVGRTAADVRDVVIKGDSGILNSSPPDFVPVYTPSNRSLLWPNGSSALAFSSEKADQLRGPQSHFTWCDELASYSIVADASGSTTWDQVVLSTRLGNRPQILATTTPRRTPIIKDLIKQAERTIETGVALVTGATLDNRANLSEDYIRAIYNRYAGTHLEKQELHGELSGDAEGALWKTEDFHFAGIPDDTDTITVIGVDPSVGNGGGDDCGILVVSAENLGWQDVNRRKAWIREDLTGQMGPDEWTQVLVETHRKYPNSIICIEGNQGRELLRFAIHQIDPTIPIALVTSKVSKQQRAEPVVLAFRQRRVFLVDSFVDLIDECTSWIPNQSKWSPGRIDAMSVALGTLLVDPRPLYPYLPAAAYRPPDGELSLNVVPSWRQYHQTHSGLALPPWRR